MEMKESVANTGQTCTAIAAGFSPC